MERSHQVSHVCCTGKSTSDMKKLQNASGSIRSLRLSEGNSQRFSDVDWSNYSRIRFEMDFTFEKKDIMEVGESRRSVPSFAPMIVYHDHVWWNYGGILVFNEQKQDGGKAGISFHLLSFGPTVERWKELPKGALKEDTPDNQRPPDIHRLTVTVGFYSDGDHRSLSVIREADLSSCEREAKHFSAVDLVSISEARAYLCDHDRIVFRTAFSVDKSYFDIDKLLQYRKDSGVPLLRNTKTLSAVLSGKKARQADFIFTSGQGDVKQFHVHKTVLINSSVILRGALVGDRSLPSELMLFITGENVIVFRWLTANDLKFLLTYMYTDEVKLPSFDAFARVGRVLSALFDSEKLLHILHRWDALLVSQLRSLEVEANREKVVTGCLEALISIHCAPYGSMPIAKRFAFSILAVEIERTDEALLEAIKGNELYKKFGCEGFLNSACALKRLIASVRKCGDTVQDE